MARYNLYGGIDVEITLSNDLFIRVNGDHVLETDSTINNGDCLYFTDDYYNEYAFRVLKKTVCNRRTFLYISPAELSDINVYGSGSSDDKVFPADVKESYKSIIKKKPEMAIAENDNFPPVAYEIYDRLGLQHLPFEHMCMIYRINEILSKMLDIKWNRPVFYESF